LAVYDQNFHAEALVECEVDLPRYNANDTLCVEQDVHVGAEVLSLEVREPEAETETAEQQAIQDDVDYVLAIRDTVIIAAVALGRARRMLGQCLVLHHLS